MTAADWTPDGRDLCVARVHPSGEVTVELPPGTVVPGAPRTRVGVDLLRLSRDGRYLVFRDLGARKIVLVDRERRTARTLMDAGGALWGLAWAPTGREIWFTEGATITARDVHAVDLDGRRRLVYRSPGNLSLVDTAPDGRALFHRSIDRLSVMAFQPGAPGEHEVTVYDTSYVGAISADGGTLLLNSQGEGSGPRSAYLRRGTGEPVRLAAGWGRDLTPDGRFALIVTDAGELSLVPIGPGLPRKIDLGALRVLSAVFIPSSPGGVIVRGRKSPEDPYGLWVLEEGGSKPRPLEAGAADTWAVAPDGRQVAVKAEGDIIRVVPIAGGLSRSIRIADANLSVNRWSADGRSLFLARGAGWPCEIHRLDLVTEKTELWKRAAPPDPTGIVGCEGILASADGRSYAYTTVRSLASLIVAEGLR